MTPGSDTGVAPTRRVVGSTLLPRIIAILAGVLIVSSSLTLLFETRQTRVALRAQALEQLSTEVSALREMLFQEQRRARAAMGQLADELVLNAKTLESVRLSTTALAAYQMLGGFDVVALFDRSGGLLGSAGGLRLAPPPEGAIAAMTLPVEFGVVRGAREDSYLRVAIVPTEQFVVVGGYDFGDFSARRLQSTAGEAEPLLVVDGRLIGATLPGLAEPPAWRGQPTSIGETGSVVIDDVTWFLGYGPLTRDAEQGWSRPAALGLMLREPVAALDAQLARTRAVGVVVLLASAIVLGWVLFRRFTQPILGLADTAQRIAQGDLDATFEVRSRDEVGLLGASLERMRQSLSDQLALIRQQSSALQESSRRIVNAQDRERRRLARDLHDGVQQQLVMLRLRVGFARAAIERDPSSLDAVTEELSAEIDRIIERLRETSQDIYPSILQDRGLQGALYSLAGRSPAPLNVRTTPDPLPRLDTSLEASAYFLIGEAVTNALKHAHAQRIDVEVTVDGESLHVVVEDDGRGLQESGHTGGLAHMRDRAAAMHGRLEVGPGRDGGCRVEAVLRAPRTRRSDVAALEVEQDGGDPPVEVQVLREPELAEDRVGVLLDRSAVDPE